VLSANGQISSNDISLELIFISPKYTLIYI